MSRILLDTNVLISAFGYGGRPALLWLRVLDGEHEMVTSPALLAELARKIPEVLGWDDARLRETIDQLIRVSDIVDSEKRLQVCRDPSDDRVLECAIDGEVEYLVTGDQDLLCLGRYEGARIVRIGDLVGEG